MIILIYTFTQLPFFFFYQLSFLYLSAVTTTVSLDNVFNFFIQPVNEILYVLRLILS